MDHPSVLRKMCLCFILIFSSLVGMLSSQGAPADSQATPQNKTLSKEKEYDDAVVLLVDAPSGMLGVEVETAETGAKQKLSFSVNPSKVYVTNQLNQNLEFSNIKPGDKVDIIVSQDKNKKEEVTDITDYNQFEKN